MLGQIGHVRVDILDGSCELLFIDRIAAHSILLHAILNIGTRTVSPGELEASSDNGLTSVGAGGLNASNTDSGGNVSSAVSASSAIADKPEQKSWDRTMWTQWTQISSPEPDVSLRNNLGGLIGPSQYRSIRPMLFI